MAEDRDEIIDQGGTKYPERSPSTSRRNRIRRTDLDPAMSCETAHEKEIFCNRYLRETSKTVKHTPPDKYGLVVGEILSDLDLLYIATRTPHENYVLVANMVCISHEFRVIKTCPR